MKSALIADTARTEDTKRWLEKNVLTHVAARHHTIAAGRLMKSVRRERSFRELFTPPSAFVTPSPPLAS